MTPHTITPDARLGDYRLLELLDDSPPRRTWLAEQLSVGRQVLLDELDPDSPETAANFLADVRAKAAVDHPLIGSVYEAVTSENHCFCAREKLSGPPLAEFLAQGTTFKPVEIARILRKISEACLHLEGRELAAAPLGPAHIHLDERGVVRLANLVTAGPRDPELSAADIARLGAELAPLVAQGHPGTSRVLTLLSWMAGQDPAVSLDWSKVRGYAQQIDQQLAEPAPPSFPQTAPVRHKPTFPIRWLLAGAGAVLAVAAIAFLAKRPQTPPPRVLPNLVEIAAGQFPGPDGSPVAVNHFWLAGHETTIREYAEFLRAIEKLAPELRTAHDHESQPEGKTTHLPDDWDALLQAATTRAIWKGRSLDLDCPVTGVDWWDAAAYCQWKGGRLPTQEEWFAAIAATEGKAHELQPAPWGPVGSCTADRTPGGLCDMAGSVTEWTRRPAANPALPMAPRKYVVIGGSAQNPANGARSREWVDTQQLRRDDVGFRIAFDHPPA